MMRRGFINNFPVNLRIIRQRYSFGSRFSSMRSSSSTSSRLHPEVKWSETSKMIFLTVGANDITKDMKVNLGPEGDFDFSAKVGPENHVYKLKLQLNDKVNVEESEIHVGERGIFCTIEKSEPGRWNDLLRVVDPPHYIKYFDGTGGFESLYRMIGLTGRMGGGGFEGISGFGRMSWYGGMGGMIGMGGGMGGMDDESEDSDDGMDEFEDSDDEFEDSDDEGDKSEYDVQSRLKHFRKEGWVKGAYTETSWIADRLLKDYCYEKLKDPKISAEESAELKKVIAHVNERYFDETDTIIL